MINLVLVSFTSTASGVLPETAKSSFSLDINARLYLHSTCCLRRRSPIHQEVLCLETSLHRKTQIKFDLSVVGCS